MKLAEGLLERKSLQEKIEALRGRLDESVLVQEGDRPPEPPEALLAELEETIKRLEALIRQINATNVRARLGEDVSIADAIVRRDMLRLRRQALEQVAQSASLRQHRYGRKEVKFVATVSPAELRKRIDGLSREWRELDARIQAANWTTEMAT